MERALGRRWAGAETVGGCCEKSGFELMLGQSAQNQETFGSVPLHQHFKAV